MSTLSIFFSKYHLKILIRSNKSGNFRSIAVIDVNISYNTQVDPIIPTMPDDVSVWSAVIYLMLVYLFIYTQCF